MKDYEQIFDQPETISDVSEPVDLDCVIVGAGPAGLTAATYLARFHRQTLVIDDGASRAALIPLSHNYPGFPPGISGEGLLERLREQAKTYGARFEQAHVDDIQQRPQGFEVFFNGRSVITRRVLLATGIEDELPDMPGVYDAIAATSIRLCSICDGYEVNGDNVAVYGEAECAISHAVFLRTFTDRVTVVVHGKPSACEEALALAEHYDIQLISDRVEGIRLLENQQVELKTCKGETYLFDIVYPSLGSRVRSELAKRLGAETDESGMLIVDEHLRTSIPGLYAAGDVVKSLKQISVATGHAAMSSTAIHNSLEINPWTSKSPAVAP
ncbi:FAD-dependent oxidoreductase [Pseudomonas asuensis]|jgi:thioredoxin reductase (NADPH)|uniref:Pyridine nucleotide-disulfide oxidoreductase n=1 Tax=Pseudomonas asuensis TaxID=1825787 RepID=A0ABQ2GL33_9PSED|nr:NAD(P)/FAD-dependent oxidoreductase [Pseudomonas asuensis]GGM01759.1 pyridine nucleotide-disulfide oxidoreductase [Pseudomonas asuensis]